MYDWTTHGVNLAKGILNENEREEESKCKICKLDKMETQVHTSTLCQHVDLVYIRKEYKKEIDKILDAFAQIKLPAKEEWLRYTIRYISKNLWGDTQATADKWNGRWTHTMLEEAMAEHGGQLLGRDIINGKNWMQRITSKLF